jgi:hypothetical protein
LVAGANFVIQESQIGHWKLAIKTSYHHTPPISSPAWQITAHVHVFRLQAIVERLQGRPPSSELQAQANVKQTADPEH